MASLSTSLARRTGLLGSLWNAVRAPRDERAAASTLAKLQPAELHRLFDAAKPACRVVVGGGWLAVADATRDVFTQSTEASDDAGEVWRR